MNSWKPDKFRASEIQENMRSQKFRVPKFQRGLVWKPNQKERLIDTIKKGLPFGTILLYYSETDHRYQIIDGLQRCNTINEFVNNPTKFFIEEDIDDSTIDGIVSVIGAVGNKNKQADIVRDTLLKWVKEKHKTMQDVESMQYYDFVVDLKKVFPSISGSEEVIIELIKKPLQNYQEICKCLLATEIPAIVITGTPDYLPDIFERINKEGISLTKQEIFAASWRLDTFHIIEESLKGLVIANRDRYDDMLDGMDILDDYDPIKFSNEKKLTAFEISFGFGKHISKEYKHLFAYNSKSTHMESIGFNLLNSCLGNKWKDVNNLDKGLNDLFPNESINKFLLRIIECINFVDKKIGKFNKFKSNSRSEISPLHTELQIVSIIASVYLIRHANIEYNERGEIKKITHDLSTQSKKWKDIKDSFSHNVSKRYILDLVQQRWSGTGDKRLDSIIIDPEYYSRLITFNEFKNGLEQWFQNMNNERREHRKINTVKEPEKLIISAIYLEEFSAMDHLDGSKYDIEHLATKNLMKTKMDRYGDDFRLPISSIGNLCLLPETINRSKRDQTIYNDEDYWAKTESSKPELTLAAIEEKYTFTKAADLEWINDDSLTQVEFEERYYSFINKRFQSILAKIEKVYNNI